MAKPSFPFYPDDWMNDLGLRGCSPASRGVWADVLCMMHQGVPYGHLADAAGEIPIKIVASRCGVTVRSLLNAIAELESHKVFSRTGQGVMFSRRMVRDERNRIARGQGGAASLHNPSVPRPKGIHKGILSMPDVVPSIGPEEVKEEESLPKEQIPKPSWEEINEVWKWFAIEYPGDVNPFVDMRLFIGVMETAADLRELQENLPMWKRSQKWLDGFFPSTENFLSKRIFKTRPKARDSPKGERRLPPAPAPPAPTPERELAAMRSLLDDPMEPEDMKAIWRKKIAEMEGMHV